MACSKFLLPVALITLLSLAACNNKTHTKEEVESAMKQYDHLIQQMNTDSIALLYTEDGDLGTMAHGRDSIRKFLDSFKAYKVLEQSSSADSVSITADSAFQTGVYHQTTITPQHDTLHIKGEYKVNWIWFPTGWHIKRIETKSL